MPRRPPDFQPRPAMRISTLAEHAADLALQNEEGKARVVCELLLTGEEGGPQLLATISVDVAPYEEPPP